ncbi:type VI secretion system-associated FHA domain protein TagH [Variovorax sp. OV329]|uniref:type VI secretion system-associated FHA domain protein TagH n=1 Tax=Variovorax sp. OV329 TaxID=1882825 RepID=UPI0008E14644|nr:type VI secretion system-associated FHA domain protein TagH [Variovorax sp. OV329]SFM80979.1 FHA domain protein [Variovorax sp. OV329]
MIHLVVVGAQAAQGGQPRSAQFGPAGGTIGRSNTNTLVLDDRTVSRTHAVVQCRGDRYFIVDQGSNPLQHNGRPLGSGNEVELGDGDRLMVGCFELTVRGDAAASPPQALATPAAGAPRPTPEDPFADLLSGIGSPPAPAPARPPSAEPASAASLLFPDPMAMGAARAVPAPMSDGDPFADLLGTGSAAPRPGAIEDFSDLGLRSPDAAAGIDHLFGGAPARPGADPLALSPLADPLLQPNTAADADPFAALGLGAPKAAPAPKADHVAIDRLGFAPPKGVVPPTAPAQGGGSLLDDLGAPPSPPVAARFDDLTGRPLAPAIAQQEDDPFADLMPSAAPAVLPPQPPRAAPPPALVQAPAPAPRATAAPASAPAPVAPVSRAAAAAVGDPSELLAAFLRGLDSTHQMPAALTPELMERIGVLLRSATEGTLQLLLARQEVKKGMHAELTMIAANANNPLKFSPTVEVALGHLLGPGMRGFMPAQEAMRDAYDDLRAHEFGVMVGMRAALAHVLARFTPEELEKKIAAKSALDSLFSANRKARLWDQFVILYGGIAAEAEDDFNTLFGKAFVKAYEEQMARLKSRGGPG